MVNQCSSVLPMCCHRWRLRKSGWGGHTGAFGYNEKH